jgi:hypothetical protein
MVDLGATLHPEPSKQKQKLENRKTEENEENRTSNLDRTDS